MTSIPKNNPYTLENIVEVFRGHNISLHPAGVWEWDKNRKKSSIDADRKDGLDPFAKKYARDNMLKHKAELSGVCVIDCDGIDLKLIDEWFPTSKNTFTTTTSSRKKQHRYLYPPKGKVFPESRAIKKHYKDLDIITSGVVFEAHDYQSPDTQFSMNGKKIKRCTEAEYKYICLILEDANKPIKQTKFIDNKNPIIDKFNKKFTCQELLMAQGYIMVRDRMIHPDSSSGVPGVYFFEDGCVYSHGSDWLNDGSSHDPFDIFAHYEHDGDKSKAMAAARDLLGLDYNGYELPTEIVDHARLNTIKSQVGYSQADKSFYMLNTSGKLISCSAKDFWDFADRTFPKAFGYHIIDQQIQQSLEEEIAEIEADTKTPEDQKEIKISAAYTRSERMAKDEYKKLASVKAKVLNDIKYHNQFKMLDYRIDPFAKESSVKIIGEVMKVVTPNLFPNLDLDEIKCDYDWAKKVYADFKQHFVEFPAILDMIIASRFGGDRKKAFIYTQMPSDFGKSFLAAAFKRLGLLVELNAKELKSIVEGSTVSVDASEFQTAWITFFDEFGAAPKELKNITYSMQVNAKYALRQEVQLYTKWFASAETSQSLLGNGGVETQFANRFCYIENSNVKPLITRKLFKAGHDKYLSGLSYMIYSIIKKKSDEYIEMGKEKAEIEAQKVVDEFVDKHKLQATLDDSAEELIDDMIEFIDKVVLDDDFRPNIEVTDLESLARLVFLKHNDKIYLQKPQYCGRFFDEFAKNRYGGEAFRKISYKKDMLRKRFHNRTKISVNGKAINAYPYKSEWFLQ